MNTPAEYIERRRHQRFLARRGENTCFWIELEGRRFPLNDLSLEGFSVPAPTPLKPGQEFDFALRLEGIHDRIRGRAQAVNEVPTEEGVLIGCAFVELAGMGKEDLKEWLTAHVISSASIRISEAEAEAIVRGPSLI